MHCAILIHSITGVKLFQRICRDCGVFFCGEGYMANNHLNTGKSYHILYRDMKLPYNKVFIAK